MVETGVHQKDTARAGKDMENVGVQERVDRADLRVPVRVVLLRHPFLPLVLLGIGRLPRNTGQQLKLRFEPLNPVPSLIGKCRRRCKGRSNLFSYRAVNLSTRSNAYFTEYGDVEEVPMKVLFRCMTVGLFVLAASPTRASDALDGVFGALTSTATSSSGEQQRRGPYDREGRFVSSSATVGAWLGEGIGTVAGIPIGVVSFPVWLAVAGASEKIDAGDAFYLSR